MSNNILTSGIVHFLGRLPDWDFLRRNIFEITKIIEFTTQKQKYIFIRYE